MWCEDVANDETLIDTFMNYLDIKHCNMVNGDGLRTVIWVAGCDRNCPGCFSPHTHNPNAGIKFDESAKDELFADSEK